MHDHRAASECHHQLVRVAVVDDHAAIRLGLTAAIEAQPGLVCAGVAADAEETQPLLHRTRPDVVVLDYHLPRADGLELCRRIKSDVLAPAVLLYSAYADAAMVVPALVAGADGIVHKGSPTRELFEAIRAVAAGGLHMPPLIPEVLEAAGAAVRARNRPIFDLLIDGTPRGEIHAALGLSSGAVDDRIGDMLARLHTGPAAGPPLGAP